MRITLDRQEIASILINWGKQQYKTHNVSVEKINPDNSMEMLVTIQEDGYSNTTANTMAQTLSKFREEPELSAESIFSGPPIDTAGNSEFL